MKPITWRGPARSDIADAADWYAVQAGFMLADRFLDAVGTAIDHVSRHPASGSMRHFTILQIDELRVWTVNGFPYLVFYVERENHIEIWRVLHAQRDIPAWITDGAECK